MVRCACPMCKGAYDAEPEWLGQQTQCPYCKNTVVIQQAAAPQAITPPQPVMPQPGMPQPGMPQPGMPQPGMTQPGMTQPGMTQPGMTQPPYMFVAQGAVVQSNRSTASLVLGIIGLIAWILPLIGFPVVIIGLILGIKKKYTAGIVLNVIALVLTVANSAIGAYMGANGMLF